MCFNHTSKQINEALMQHFMQDIVDFIAWFFLPFVMRKGNRLEEGSIKP